MWPVGQQDVNSTRVGAGPGGTPNLEPRTRLSTEAEVAAFTAALPVGDWVVLDVPARATPCVRTHTTGALLGWALEPAAVGAPFQACGMQGCPLPLNEQLQRLRGLHVPTPGWLVMTKPTAADLQDHLAQRITEARHALAGLLVVHQPSGATFLFCAPQPLRACVVRVRFVRWVCEGGVWGASVVLQANNLACKLKLDATTMALGVGPGARVHIAKAGTDAPRLLAVVKPARVQLPLNSRWLEGRLVETKSDTEQVVCTLRAFWTALGVPELPLPVCQRLVDHGATRVFDWWTVAQHDRQLAGLVRAGPFDYAALAHASGCFGAMGALKVAILAAAVPDMHEHAVEARVVQAVPGLRYTEADVIVAAAARWRAFWRQHGLDGLPLRSPVSECGSTASSPHGHSHPNWVFGLSMCSHSPRGPAGAGCLGTNPFGSSPLGPVLRRGQPGF